VASNKRERELARMRAERQAARRAAAEARRRQRRNTALIALSALAVVAIVVGVAWVAGVGDTKPATQSTSTFGNLGGTGSCTYKKGNDSARKLAGLPPAQNVLTTGTQHAILQTSKGTIEADLLTSKAPCTVNSFVFLAQQKYYDNTACHRLVTSGIYVLQCGDPTATGSGGPGYTYPDENLQGATYPAGTLAMANGGPGTNGSQFFLVYKQTQLPPSYTPFGKITKGLDIVEKVAAGGDDGSSSAGGGKPKIAISLTKVTVVGKT
jgi:peptidyl-prolyl cis-trans isomerase B (cyclophilin B)